MSKKQEKIYGYARVSTGEQNEDRQIIALKEMGGPESNIYVSISCRERILSVRSIRDC